MGPRRMRAAAPSTRRRARKPPRRRREGTEMATETTPAVVRSTFHPEVADYAQVNKDANRLLTQPGKGYLLLLGTTIFLVLLMVVAELHNIWFGLGMSGLTNPVGWGVCITSFVFWVGIGHAGTLISAILFLFRAP